MPQATLFLECSSHEYGKQNKHKKGHPAALYIPNARPELGQLLLVPAVRWAAILTAGDDQGGGDGRRKSRDSTSDHCRPMLLKEGSDRIAAAVG